MKAFLKKIFNIQKKSTHKIYSILGIKFKFNIFNEPKAFIYPNVSIGYSSYVKFNSVIFSNTIIGNYCSIANNCSIGAINHDLQNLSTTRPAIGKVDPARKTIEQLNPKQTIIKDDVWIGCNCTVIVGVTIGQSAIIGAGSVITKDVPPYAIVCGNPARIKKYRFSEEIIEQLLILNWGKYKRKELENIHSSNVILAIEEIKKIRENIL